MYLFRGGVNEVYPLLMQAVLADGAHITPRGTSTKELHPVTVQVTNPNQRLVTSYGRPINVTFALVELMWILAGMRDVETLQFYNGNISDYSDDGEVFNAAYGHRMKYNFGMDQITGVVQTLQADRDSRQAVLQLWDASQDLPVINGEPNVTKDRACNVLAHLMIRDESLHWMQIIRSNDLAWGTPYNWMQWLNIQAVVATQLGIPAGPYWHVVDSLHLYAQHWKEAADIKAFDIYQYLPGHAPVTFAGLHRLLEIEPHLRSELEPYELRNTIDSLPLCWKAVARLIQAHVCYKAGDNRGALNFLRECPDKIYAAAQARFYYHWRWKDVADMVQPLFMANEYGWQGGPALQEWITSGN